MVAEVFVGAPETPPQEPLSGTLRQTSARGVPHGRAAWPPEPTVPTARLGAPQIGLWRLQSWLPQTSQAAAGKQQPHPWIV